MENEQGETEDRSYPSGEDWCGLTWESSLELLYAEQFTVDYYEGGYTRIVIADEDVYLLVPETADTSDDGASAEAESETDIAAAAGMDTEMVLESLPDDVVVLQQPIENIYLVATSAMDFFASLDALDSIRLSGTNADGWYIEEAQEAMKAGDILYAGKYSAPDYELILSENCGLAIESTMIYHNPEVQEKLETFGIPVLVERSSYESHPMGRTEWIKLYAVLLGLEDEAEEIFSEQAANVQAIESEESLGKTVAFFYITSAGAANVRKSNDYVAKMIELAGGTYVFEDLGEDDSATSTINMTMEEFYAGACDADYIIYNSTIDGELYTMDELLGKSALLADFTAVQNGNVWCTGKNLFQETTSLGDLIVEIHTILSDEDVDDGELEFLHRIEE
ncbi:MAG: ABC transporter substrate-binding protein [Clostridiales bacterium]|nr:ABC transporter substrate-binding protein [Clostridiales bacterium]